MCLLQYSSKCEYKYVSFSSIDYRLPKFHFCYSQPRQAQASPNRIILYSQKCFKKPSFTTAMAKCRELLPLNWTLSRILGFFPLVQIQSFRMALKYLNQDDPYLKKWKKYSLETFLFILITYIMVGKFGSSLRNPEFESHLTV